jgi:hypothetical protein
LIQLTITVLKWRCTLASGKIQTSFNGSLIEMGGYLRIEFETDLLMWVMVDKVMPRSVKATILERGRTPYVQGRVMDIFLEYAREYRSKDNPPGLLGMAYA